MKKIFDKAFMDLNKIAAPTAREIFLSEDSNRRELSEKEFAFFSSIQLKNGVTKTTDRNRMRDVDEWFCGFLPKDKTLKVLDVGISSGITTVEMCETFEAQGIDYRVVAMDSDITAFLLVFRDGRSVLLDKDGEPIHFETGGQGFGYIKGTNVRHRLERTLLESKSRAFGQKYLKHGLQTAEESAAKIGAKLHRIELVCREIRENPSISILENSIFSKDIGGKYDLIRAANILNNGYFTDDQLSDAVRNLGEKLEIDGHLLICRTNSEGQNNATLFVRRENGKFEKVGNFGKGSEIEDLVLNLEL